MMVLDISTLQALGAALFFGTGLVLTNIGFRWTGALQGGMVSISTVKPHVHGPVFDRVSGTGGRMFRA